MNEYLDELKNLEDIKYYYHVTNNDCDSIMETGLFMEGDKIYTTANPLPSDFWDDPIQFAKNEQGMFYRNNANIVIIGIPVNSEEEIIERTNTIPDGWILDSPPEYRILSKYILGYVDTKKEELILNDNYDNIYGMVL